MTEALVGKVERELGAHGLRMLREISETVFICNLPCHINNDASSSGQLQLASCRYGYRYFKFWWSYWL